MLRSYINREWQKIMLIKSNGTLNGEKDVTLLKTHMLSDIAEGEIFENDGSTRYTS